MADDNNNNNNPVDQVFNGLINAAKEGYSLFADEAAKFGIDVPGNLPDDGSLGSDYQIHQRFFPDNLASDGSFNQHWILININVNQRTNFNGSVGFDGGNYQLPSTLTGELSKVDNLRDQIDQRFRSGAPRVLSDRVIGERLPGRDVGPGRVFVPRQTRRIVEAIAIFMPSTVVFTQNNEYRDVRLTEDLLPGAITRNALVSAGKTIAGLAQAPVNPRVEVIFDNTNLRQFQFDFLLAPTTEQESASLHEIIKAIRYHAAPEVQNFTPDGGGFGGLLGSVQGLLWTPPSEFDLTFMYGAQENFNLPRINTCVLESIDVDYAPSGVYSTFQNGAPVKVRMMLKFRELEVLHKLRVIQGF